MNITNSYFGGEYGDINILHTCDFLFLHTSLNEVETNKFFSLVYFLWQYFPGLQLLEISRENPSIYYLLDILR